MIGSSQETMPWKDDLASSCFSRHFIFYLWRMNRLVLIGNGFDLAHGMKTSYADFILWCIKEAFQGAKQGMRYEHPLMSVERANVFFYDPSRMETLEDFMPYFNEGDPIRSEPFLYWWKISNSFIRHIVLNCYHCGWVDIENEFYDELKRIQQLADLKNKQKSLEELNKAFGKLRMQLQRYLSTLTVPHVHATYVELFQEKFVVTDFPEGTLLEEYPRGIHLLNFNYTRLAGMVEGIAARADAPAGIHVNYIHGQLNNDNNPIIFGFGDELDDAYLKMELEKTRGFFKFIKSFGYFRTSHYRDLIRYIDGDLYQVYVMGHACGLSDRTMLNMIFEHKNCQSIKLFYHQHEERNNYPELVEDVARHFHNKQLMRRLIVPFDHSMKMPQVE